MAKLRLDPNPTFPATVIVPVAGDAPVQVKITFKHRTKDQLQEFTRSRADKTDADSILAMACAWDLEEPFTEQNIEKMCQNYIAAPLEIYKAYLAELLGEKAKN